jgi:hypothetical protein
VSPINIQFGYLQELLVAVTAVLTAVAAPLLLAAPVVWRAVRSKRGTGAINRLEA